MELGLLQGIGREEQARREWLQNTGQNWDQRTGSSNTVRGKHVGRELTQHPALMECLQNIGQNTDQRTGSGNTVRGNHVGREQPQEPALMNGSRPGIHTQLDGRKEQNSHRNQADGMAAEHWPKQGPEDWLGQHSQREACGEGAATGTSHDEWLQVTGQKCQSERSLWNRAATGTSQMEWQQNTGQNTDQRTVSGNTVRGKHVGRELTHEPALMNGSRTQARNTQLDGNMEQNSQHWPKQEPEDWLGQHGQREACGERAATGTSPDEWLQVRNTQLDGRLEQNNCRN
jgi:hypothetical protein